MAFRRSLLGLTLLICISNCRHSKAGGRHGRHRLESPSGRHFHGTSGVEGPLTETDVNKLLPYEALENTDVRERQLLPDKITGRYYTSQKLYEHRSIERSRGKPRRRKRRSRVDLTRHGQDIGHGSVSVHGNLTNARNGTVQHKAVEKDKHIPQILVFYKSQKEKFEESRRQLSERFIESMHQSLPRDVPIEDDPWKAIFAVGDRETVGFQPPGDEFPVLQAPPRSRGFPWPMPQSLTIDPGRVFRVNPQQFRFKLADGCNHSDVIQAALIRFSRRLTLLGATMTTRPRKGGTVGTVHSLVVAFHGGSSSYPNLQSDESYMLSVNGSTASLESAEVWGALHGLETFIQLLHPCGPHQLCVNASSVRDWPRYGHRGVLLDTSRHFLSPRLLKMNMDAMAMNKLNVLHWHMVDDQSFPFVSRAFPSLSGKGAYSQAETYDHDVIRELVEYGRLRGIRIIPEFDTPGHTKSWGAGHPELLTQCAPEGVGPIDPSRNATYALLSRLFSEIMGVFPGQELHLGGDECSYRCWSSNRHILDFMRDRGFGSDFSRLEQYYFHRLCGELATLGEHRDYVFWQEVVDNGVKVPANSIIQVWKGLGGGDRGLMRRLTDAGLRVIYSAGWYLNYVSYGQDWHKYYSLDPREYVDSERGQQLVIGGEACVWGEYIDDSNLLQTIWPRASAVAERLWSPEHVNSVTQAGPRFEEHRCRMIRSGIPASPNSGPSSCSG